jgi:hypothetical protein
MIAGRDYLPVIERLAEDASSASMRTRIGRYHYAAFLECRAYCEQRMGYTRSKMAREHQAIANLVELRDPVLADALKDLRIARNAADYDDRLDTGSVSTLLERAESLSLSVLSRLDRLESKN